MLSVSEQLGRKCRYRLEGKTLACFPEYQSKLVKPLTTGVGVAVAARELACVRRYSRAATSDSELSAFRVLGRLSINR